MMKLYCERCEAEGVIENGFNMIYCPHCDGKGYTENKEVERLVRIGKATEKAYSEGYNLNIVICPNECKFKNTQSLLEWLESED